MEAASAVGKRAVNTLPQAVFVYSSDFAAHRYPEECPFKTTRAPLTRSIAASMGFLFAANVRESAPEPAGRAALTEVHADEYLDALLAGARGHHEIRYLQMGLGTDDCPTFPDMYDYAALACSATLTAADLIIEGLAESAFNPSGGFHHAGLATASGFCYLNDIALACLRLSRAGLRVMAIDLDVHHGEGVQAALYERRDVLCLSFHETGKHLFPGTGFDNETRAPHAAE
jgi:acetoin utilization protein AcuC